MNIARQDFDSAYMKGFWHSVLAWFTQEKNQLLPFDEIRSKLPLRGQHDIGLQQIPLNQIIGSVGRYQDFDRAFLPRRNNIRTRWENIDSAQLRDIVLPPIDVYKIGEVYFVKDGNHRVSVARERGQYFIDANVVEIESAVPIDSVKDIDELLRNQQRVKFLEQTHLNDLWPDANVEFTVPGGYERLLEHISVHRWFMGEKRRGPVSYLDAVADWYDQVYMPLIKVIRDNHILNDFPSRTEADLYLWVIEHIWYMREEVDEEISLEDAAEHFADEYSERPLKQLVNNLKKFALSLSGNNAEHD